MSQTPITAYISEELSERLRIAAAEKKQTISEYLRRLLEHQFKVTTELPRRGRPPKEIEPEEKTA